MWNDISLIKSTDYSHLSVLSFYKWAKFFFLSFFIHHRYCLSSFDIIFHHFASAFIIPHHHSSILSLISRFANPLTSLIHIILITYIYIGFLKLMALLSAFHILTNYVVTLCTHSIMYYQYTLAWLFGPPREVARFCFRAVWCSKKAHT